MARVMRFLSDFEQVPRAEDWTVEENVNGMVETARKTVSTNQSKE